MVIEFHYFALEDWECDLMQKLHSQSIPAFSSLQQFLEEYDRKN